DVDLELFGEAVEIRLERRYLDRSGHPHLDAHRVDGCAATGLGARKRLHFADRDVSFGEQPADASDDPCLVDARGDELVDVASLRVAVRHRWPFERPEEDGQTAFPLEPLAGARQAPVEIVIAAGEK